MTEVTLHGKLAQAVGRAKWKLHVKSPQEALKLIEANSRRLLKFLYSEEGMNGYYRVILDGKDFTAGDELLAPIKNYKTIEFVPVVQGAGSGGWLAIIGVLLLVIAISIFTWGAGTAASPGLFAGTTAGTLSTTGTLIAGLAFSLGVSFVLQGISSLLTKSPTTSNTEASYLFSGAVNTVNQGNCVPLCYGELIVGSQQISSGLSAADIPFTT